MQRRLALKASTRSGCSERQRFASAETPRTPRRSRGTSPETARPALRVQLVAMLRTPLPRPLDCAPLAPRIQSGQHLRFRPERRRPQPLPAPGAALSAPERDHRRPPIKLRDLRRQVHVARVCFAKLTRGSRAAPRSRGPPIPPGRRLVMNCSAGKGRAAVRADHRLAPAERCGRRSGPGSSRRLSTKVVMRSALVLGRDGSGRSCAGLVFRVAARARADARRSGARSQGSADHSRCRRARSESRLLRRVNLPLALLQRLRERARGRVVEDLRLGELRLRPRLRLSLTRWLSAFEATSVLLLSLRAVKSTGSTRSGHSYKSLLARTSSARTCEPLPK
jgi:hypothetical protein